jgi:hypothetical protein
MRQAADDVQRLTDKYLMLAESQENQRRLRCWESTMAGTLDWHRPPRLHAFREERLVPIQVVMEHPYLLSIFPQDLRQVYQDSAAYFRFYLQKKIWSFENVHDDIPLDGHIRICFRSPFESSLFGVPYHLYADRDPQIDQRVPPPVRSRADLDRLSSVDFYQAGMMPLARRLYEGVRELAGDAFTVAFPEWLRSPFGVALYVHGYEDLLADLVTDPEFAKAIMGRITQEREAWFEARARYLGDPIPPATILDDEVDMAVIGPHHYREHILPHERAIARYHQRIIYWHSCGNITGVARDILSMGHIELLDVSGWTDLEGVLSSITQNETEFDGKNQRLEIRFKPVEDVQDASPQRIDERLRGTVRLCRDYDVSAFCLRANGLQPWESPAKDVAKANQWVNIARRIVEEESN